MHLLSFLQGRVWPALASYPVLSTPCQVSTAKPSGEGGLKIANTDDDSFFLYPIHTAFPAKPNC